MRDLNYYGNYCIEMLNAIDIYPNKIDKFDVNTRAKRRWGQAKRKDGKYSININVELLSDNCPEKSLLETLYHELLHCVDGCMNHGAKWQELADLVSDCYDVEITRCSSEEDKLGTEYANELKIKRQNEKKLFKIECEKCNKTYSRMGYRKPKWYAHPNNYICNCGGRFKIV